MGFGWLAGLVMKSCAPALPAAQATDTEATSPTAEQVKAAAPAVQVTTTAPAIQGRLAARFAPAGGSSAHGPLHLAVGAAFDLSERIMSGSAYLFEQQGTNWVVASKLWPEEQDRDGNLYCSSLRWWGNTLAVALPDGFGQAVYVYEIGNGRQQTGDGEKAVSGQDRQPDYKTTKLCLRVYFPHMLSIKLLGQPQVRLDGQPVQLRRRKSRALLYYVAAARQPVSRERLLGLLWPDTPRAAAQQVLRTTLHGLRQDLGEALATDGDTVGLAAGSQVDVREFEALLNRPDLSTGELRRAVDLYGGDFLADFILPEGQEYEDWVTVEAERYRRQAVRALAELSARYEADGDYAGALAALERALAFNPLQEDLARERIRLLYLAGDRPGAILRYDELRKLLDEEMGVPPMAETRRLYDEILKDEVAAPVAGSRRSALRIAKPRGRAGDRDRGERKEAVGEPVIGETSAGGDEALELNAGSAIALALGGAAGSAPAGGVPFTGRAMELERLRTMGAGQKLVLIEGEAGIGKTRLAEEFLRSVTLLPLVGRARELDQSLPYMPLIDALRSLLKRPDWPERRKAVQAALPNIWLEEASRLLPELAIEGSAGQYSPTAPTVGASRPVLAPGTPAMRPADESRLWEGVHQLLEALAKPQGLIVFLDDLQWADASTLALLGYLARQSSTVPVSFLATVRSIPPRSPLASLVQALTREDRLSRMTLNRLEPEDVEAIARKLSPKDGQALAEWLQSTSEGNPYILVELVRYARDHGLIRPTGEVDREALIGSPVVPQTVYSLIQSRLERLSEPAQRVLNAAVPAGREFEFDLAARAAGLSENAALDALDELRQAGLVLPVESEDPAKAGLYAFDHTLTMEVAYREVGELRHRLMHRRIAEALESLYPDRLEALAGLIAYHFSEGNEPRRAAPYAFRAGQQAANLAAWTEAVAFFEQALQSSETSQRLEILLALGNVQLQAAHASQSSDVLREALLLALSRGDKDMQEEIQIELARSLIPQSRYSEIVELARQLTESKRAQTVMNAEIVWGTALAIEGSDLEEAARHLHRAERLWQEQAVQSPAVLSEVKFELGSIRAQQGELPEAIRLYRESLTAAEQGEGETALLQRVLALNNLAYHLLLLGDPTASEHAQAGLALAREKGMLGIQPFLLSTLGEIALSQGELGTAERYFNEGLAIAEQFSVPERIAGLKANLGLVAIERGETALAIHQLSTALGLADSLGTRHLAAQIRLWLAPLLPQAERKARLAEARAIVESSGRMRLQAELERLERDAK